MNRLLVPIAIGCLILSVTLTVVTVHDRANTIDQANRSVCLAIRNLNVVVTAQLERSRANVQKLAYFREHPDELRDQIRQIDRQLVAFRPRDCG